MIVQVCKMQDERMSCLCVRLWACVSVCRRAFAHVSCAGMCVTVRESVRVHTRPHACSGHEHFPQNAHGFPPRLGLGPGRSDAPTTCADPSGFPKPHLPPRSPQHPGFRTHRWATHCQSLSRRGRTDKILDAQVGPNRRNTTRIVE